MKKAPRAGRLIPSPLRALRAFLRGLRRVSVAAHDARKLCALRRAVSLRALGGERLDARLPVAVERVRVVVIHLVAGEAAYDAAIAVMHYNVISEIPVVFRRKVVDMSRVKGMPYDAHVVDLYISGMETRDVAEKLGIGRNAVYNALSRCGVKVRGKKLPAPSGVVERYESGTSVYELAGIYGVSRPTVVRWLTDAGVTIRDRSTAGLVRASKMTPEERDAKAAAAHVAATGRRHTVAEKVKHARTTEANATLDRCSSGERLIAEYFIAHGFEVTLEKAVHIYNLDIAIGDRFAVEVQGGNWHSMKKKRREDVKRLEYLMSAGWRIAYVWDTNVIPITEAAAEKCVSIMKMTGVDPSSDGEYWVVRGDGKVTTCARRYIDDLALVLPTQASTNPDGSEISLW